MPDTPDDFIGDGNEGMFAFKKVMQKIWIVKQFDKLEFSGIYGDLRQAM